MYQEIDPEVAAVEATYLISTQADPRGILETLENLQEAREETLRGCDFDDAKLQEIEEAETVVLAALIDRSTLGDNQWEKP